MNDQRICVVGLGYIGLPTATLFATRGFDVVGVDVEPHVVETINQGRIHIEEPGLAVLCQAAVASGKLKASLTMPEADVYFITVPTPFDTLENGHKVADLSYVDAATDAIAAVVTDDALVVLESTSPPGTTRRCAERLAAKGKHPDLAHCPERVIPGAIIRELTQNDRVVGGLTEQATVRAAQLYNKLVDGEVLLTDATTAELVKLMENTYRDVNIALANELGDICEDMGIDAWEVIRLANRHPRVNLHSPGPGVGGHCLSIDPWFVVDSAPHGAPVVQLGREVNDSVPVRQAKRVAQGLEGRKGAKVCVLGVTYKGNVDDTREAPAIELIHTLREALPDAEIAVYDPHVTHFSPEPQPLEAAVGGADRLVIAAAHSEFKFFDPAELKRLVRQPVVWDLCGMLDRDKWRQAGFTVRVRGVGG